MPDITRKTISATEMGALFGVSPYATPFMLYQRFVHGVSLDATDHSRLSWGTLLEPVLLKHAADTLGLEVHVNRDAQGIQAYVSKGLLGCSRDATIIAPDIGPGALETKCVFDYGVWMRNWDGGDRPPPHYEIQLQMQMKIGDGVTPYQWGMLYVFVCGDVKTFKREPIPALWDAFDAKAAAFMADVEARREPKPFGIPIEDDLVKRLYPPTPKKTMEILDTPDAYELVEQARLLNYHTTQESEGKRGKEVIKSKFLGVMLGAEELFLPYGVIVRQKKHGNGVRMTAFVPDTVPENDLHFLEGADNGS